MYHPSLSHFITVADFMNISRAAEHLHISQQALSTYIKKLEEHYGEPLFQRRPALSLTPAGKRVLKAASEIEQIYLRLEQELGEAEPGRATLSLGILYPKMKHYSRHLPVLEYRDLYPNVFLNIIEQSGQQLEEMLTARLLDFYVGDGSLERQGLTASHLFYERFFLVITDELLRRCFKEDYPYCIPVFENGVNLSDFAHVPQFVLPGHMRISALIHRFYHKNGVAANIAGENPNVELNLQMALHNYGFTICPEYSVTAMKKQHEEKGLPAFHAFPVARPYLDRLTSIVYRMNEEYPEHVCAFMKMIADSLKKTVEEEADDK